MEDFISAKIIDGDIVFFFEKGHTQKDSLEFFEKKIDMMKSIFNLGDSFFIYIENEDQYNLIPKIAKLAISKNLRLAGAFFGELPESKKYKSEKEFNLSNTKIYRKHLRSGQTIDNPGDIIIFGNVKPGSEVNAGGSVIVFGKVEGIVKAGITNPKNSFIIASEMASPLLEIAGIPFYNYTWPKTPVSIRIEKEKALVEPLEL